MIQGWLTLNFNFPYTEELYVDSRLVEYQLTVNKLWRAIASTNVHQKICEFFDLDLDVGYYKTPPGWSYRYHQDNTRKCAFNQLLCDPNTAYTAKIFVAGKVLVIPYKNDKLTLIDTSLYHNVRNNSINDTRYLLNIGVNNFKSFEDTIEHLLIKRIISL